MTSTEILYPESDRLTGILIWTALFCAAFALALGIYALNGLF